MPVQFRFYFGDSPIVSDKFGPGESNCELVVSRSDDGTFYLTDHTPKAIALINQQTRWAVQDSKDVLAFAVHMIRAVNGTVLKNVRDA